eukprot:gnl/TRDRNA2_/TRDRNA2_185103_c0_seq1.p1 gnl/TRDRNA2_/TRDRNA2_185103_c0~~gnl/TRDRNA2_/TRDRNA2_185103_c0_seq1.p1  ORF type:complete len:173 (-),score=26.22 gnl/TRDRNA2_/TRDRNA2_185103_c0_seq1:7-459(-)
MQAAVVIVVLGACSGLPIEGGDDELGLLQLRKATNNFKFAAGMSYKGECTFADEPNEVSDPAEQQTVIRLKLLSEHEGQWREEHDMLPDEQKFTITHQGDRVRLSDAITQFAGKIDDQGVISGDMEHDGVRVGTFVLTPDTSGRDYFAHL